MVRLQAAIRFHHSGPRLCHICANVADTISLFFILQVAVRFKPGDRVDSRLVLPLHQRLRMRKTGDDIVAREPPEFLDALMNTIMTDPVKLPDSGRCARH